MNSKGITTVALNWIFVLIAGGVILLFFFNILTVQTKISQGEVSARVLRDLQAVLVGKSVNEGVESTIRMPKQAVEFYCEEPCTPETGCESRFGIKNSEFTFDSATQVLFSHSTIDSDIVYSFAIAWKVPFHVTNFLYLVEPTQKIVFVESQNDLCKDDLCEEVYSLIPQRIKDSGVALKGEYPIGISGNTKKITYVQFGNCPAVGIATGPAQAFLCVENNLIWFYEGGSRVSKSFLDEATLLGAIVGGDSSLFECNMKKAFFRLNKVGEGISEKMSTLKDLYQGSGFPTDACHSELSTFLGMDSYFESYVQLENTRDSLLNSMQELEELNSYMQRRSCAAIY